MKIFCIFLIKIYKAVISPLLGQNCRFYPCCSEYALTCFDRFSFFKAIWYSIRRVIRCNPLIEGGVDPAPQR